MAERLGPKQTISGVLFPQRALAWSMLAPFIHFSDQQQPLINREWRQRRRGFQKQTNSGLSADQGTPPLSNILKMDSSCITPNSRPHAFAYVHILIVIIILLLQFLTISSSFRNSSHLSRGGPIIIILFELYSSDWPSWSPYSTDSWSWLWSMTNATEQNMEIVQDRSPLSPSIHLFPLAARRRRRLRWDQRSNFGKTSWSLPYWWQLCGVRHPSNGWWVVIIHNL